jgi:hypothetical protein
MQFNAPSQTHVAVHARLPACQLSYIVLLHISLSDCELRAGDEGFGTK